MQRLIRKLLDKRGLLSVGAVSVTLLLLLMPTSESDHLSVQLPFVDKLAHISLFAACSFAIFTDLRLKQQTTKNKIAGCAAILIFGLLIGYWVEVMQGRYLGRTYSTADIVADGVGLVLGICVAYFTYNWLILRENKN